MKAAWIGRSVQEQLRDHRGLAAAAILAFALLAVATGSVRLGAQTASRWRMVVGQNVHVIAYLSEDVTRERALEMADVLRRASAVAQTTVIEPGESFARLAAAAQGSGVAPRTLENLEPNYFPRSIEVHLLPAPDLVQRASDLASRMRDVPGVVQVDSMTTGLARLAVWMDLGRRLGQGVLVAALIVTSFLLAAVCLRSRAVLRQRSAVLVQLGASAAGILLPSCVWMAGAAFLGGCAGTLLLGLSWNPVLLKLERTLGIVTSFPRPGFGVGDVFLGLLISLLLGCLLGFFATPLPRTRDHV